MNKINCFFFTELQKKSAAKIRSQTFDENDDLESSVRADSVNELTNNNISINPGNIVKEHGYTNLNYNHSNSNTSTNLVQQQVNASKVVL